MPYISGTSAKMSRNEHSAAIVGGGPAGLMAAEALCARGVACDLYDAMPSLGRKFLMAGKSGLNLTHAEPLADFLGRFAPPEPRLLAMIEAFPPDATRAWARDLGIETFTGSSGRVFPSEMKAAPLLRAWLRRLRGQGLRIHVRHRWTGWDESGALTFETPSGEVRARPSATVLALGGASWPRLGSDGAWVDRLAARGVGIAPLRPSNCGFDVAWSDRLRAEYQGQPLKRVALRFGGARAVGDVTITADGLEGGPVYTLSAALVAAIERDGAATLEIDLLPGTDEAALAARLARPRGKASLGNHLRKSVGIDGAKAAILFEDPAMRACSDAAVLARRIKALPVRLERPRPLAEAISTAGGIAWDALSDGLELTTLPGVFAAGEMLDWDAPTGGYLLTGCLATGRHTGCAVADFLSPDSPDRFSPS